MKKLIFISLIIIVFLGCSCSFAQSGYIIDSPTTDLLDYGSYNLNFRLFSEGGILTRLSFGVFNIVNLGFGWEVNKVIGNHDVIVAAPTLYLKIKPFAGGEILPALAFGYDGQGYFYDKDKGEFTEKEKGIFLVIGRELFISGMEFNVGGNIFDYKTGQIYGFVNANYNIENKFAIFTEYDNIHNVTTNRFSIGGRFFITNSLYIDLAGRDIGASGRSAERIILINYTGRF